MSHPSLTFKPAGSAPWPDLESLFEARGGPKNCWCMAWRGTPDERQGKVVRKGALQARALCEQPLGLIAYLEEEPVGWVSIAPRTTYRPLGGPVDPDPSPCVWSLVCFYVPSRCRRQGWSAALLEAAIRYARDQGAEVVEGYPVAPDSPSYRFMGFEPLFESAGFEHVGTAGSRRVVMRLRVDGD